MILFVRFGFWFRFLVFEFGCGYHIGCSYSFVVWLVLICREIVLTQLNCNVV